MYRQGALDSLCGVYAVINSTKAMADERKVRISREGCRELFVALCDALAQDERLAVAITSGMEIQAFRKLLRAAHHWAEDAFGLRLSSVRAFNTQPEGLSAYWDRVQTHAETFGAGSVLLCMNGRYDHWSCVRSITQRRISLFDSDGIQHLDRDRCTVAATSGRRQHILRPTQTLLISDQG